MENIFKWFYFYYDITSADHHASFFTLGLSKVSDEYTGIKCMAFISDILNLIEGTIYYNYLRKYRSSI